MIDWATWRPAVLALVSTLATETDDSVPTWDESRQPFTDPKTQLRLSLKVTNIHGYGRDEERYSFNSSTRVLTEEIHGQRAVRVQVRFEHHEAADDLWAFGFSEKVRTRLRRQSSLDALLAVNTSIIEIGDTRNFSAPFDDTVETIAMFEMVLGVAFQDNNPYPAGTGWIEAITYDSHIQDVTGTELPVPPNVVNALVPANWTSEISGSESGGATLTGTIHDAS